MLKPCGKWCPRTKEYKLEVDITNRIYERDIDSNIVALQLNGLGQVI